MSIAGLLAVPNEPRWLIVYDERPGSPPNAPARYVYIPLSPRAFPGFARYDASSSSYRWRSFEAMWEGRDPPVAKESGGEAETDFPPPIAGQDFWLPRGAQLRAIFPLIVPALGGPGRFVRLTLTLALGGAGRLGLSRDDSPPSSAIVRPIDVLFGGG